MHKTVRVNHQSSYKGLTSACQTLIPFIKTGEFLGQHEIESQEVSNVGLCLLVLGHIE